MGPDLAANAARRDYGSLLFRVEVFADGRHRAGFGLIHE